MLEAIRAMKSGTPRDHWGTPTRWLLMHDGAAYAPKAAIGMAAFFAFGWPLAKTAFSSGEEPGQAVGYLRRLGFEVIRQTD